MKDKIVWDNEIVWDEPKQGIVWDEEMSITDKIRGAGQKALDGLFFGFGDEIAASGLAAIDSLATGADLGQSYEMYLAETRDIENRFEEKEPGLSAGIEIGTSLVPSLKLGAMVGNAATRLGNVVRQSALGAGEMAVREFAEGEGDVEKRLKDIDPLVVGIGAGAGGFAGTLMRGQNSVNAIRAAEAAAKKSGDISNLSKINRALASVRDDAFMSARIEVGEIPARQMVTADFQSTVWKQDLHAPGRLPVKDLDHLTSALESNPLVSKYLADAGAVQANGKRLFNETGRKALIKQASDTLERSDPAAANTLRKMNQVIEVMQQDLRRVFPNAAKEMQSGYFPLYAKADDVWRGVRSSKGGASKDASTLARETGLITEEQALKAFNNPVNNFMSFFEDTVDALALARVYGVKSEAKTLSGIHNYTQSVIKAIVKDQTKKIGKEKAERLGEHLAVFAIDGRAGMGQLATMLRTISHSALLGTFENALLQAGDLGQAAYATSFSNAIKSLPKALKSVILTDGDLVVTNKGMQDTLRMADLGLTRQHLTELVNENRSWLPKHVTKLGDFFMKASGVRKANRLGVETNLNAQISQMRSLVTQGKLAGSVYTEGLTPQQISRLEQGIKSGNVRDKAVMEAAFFRLGRFQPVMRTAMPVAYLKADSGRLLWSMKMYMTKMASRFNEDVLEPVYKAERAGLNTEAGRALMRKAILNTVRYSSFILALNAIVDPKRKEITRGKESDNSYPEEFVRQGVSFATGGLVDINASEQGRTIAGGLVPPAVQAAFAPIEIALDYLQNGEVSPSDMKRAAMFVPGIRQALWAQEVIEEHD